MLAGLLLPEPAQKFSARISEVWEPLAAAAFSTYLHINGLTEAAISGRPFCRGGQFKSDVQKDCEVYMGVSQN